MRILILIALLFAFTAGGFVDVAHAFALDNARAHHQVEQGDIADNEHCHSKQDQNNDQNICDDCCCAHSHSVATSPLSTRTDFNLGKHHIIASANHHESADLSGLKRPPRL